MAAGQNSAVKQAAAAAAAGVVEEGVDKNHPCVGINRVIDHDKGLIEMLDKDGKPRKKFAMVGFASSTCMAAPFDEPDWAIMGMNQLYRRIPREDVHIEIHREWNTALVPGSDHKGWLAECGIPILMTHRVEGLPTSVRYPVEPMIDLVADYFTSTVAYMMAYLVWHIERLIGERGAAGEIEFKTPGDLKKIYAEYSIGVFGIDLVVGEEYDWQKACAEFWIGYALAKGITVLIPKESALCKQRYRYGYEAEPNDLIKDSDIAKRQKFLEDQLTQHANAATQLTGALQELAYIKEFRTLRERGAVIG